MKGSNLWDEYNRAMRSLAPKAMADLDACRMLVALDEALMAGEKTDPKTASKYAQQIIGCFRAKDFADVDTFAVALVATLCQYPEPIVRMIACPLNGIPRTKAFCPSIAEIANELDEKSKNIATVGRFARRALQAPR